DLQESKRQKREKREGGRISSGFVKADLEGQTDPDRADILWEASSVMKLVVTVLQQCCLECLVNPTVRSSLIELKFGRGVVDWFILDLYGGISLWLPESFLSLCSVQVVEQGGRGCTHIHLYSGLLSGLRSRGFSFSHRGDSHKVRGNTIATFRCASCPLSPTVNSEIFRGYQKGNPEGKINEIVAGSYTCHLFVSNAYLEYLKGPRTRILFEFVKEMPKPETKLRLNIASLIGAVFFTWVILLLFPVSSF
ncbi:hypothetical protein F2Q70_00035856, partial [Brassica cretica]